MKKLKLAERLGFAQIFVLIGMLLVAISLPIATKLVQQNQENRSNAATKCSGGNGTVKCTGSGQMWYCTNGKWGTASVCGSKKCNSSGTACGSAASTATSTAGCSGGASHGSYKCSGSVKYRCDDGKWVNVETCSYGCSGSACTSAPAASSTAVSASGCGAGSDCGKCGDSSSCTNVGCLWGYNGSSSMYCYRQEAAVPTAKPTVATTLKLPGRYCDNANECASNVCTEHHCLASSNDCWSTLEKQIVINTSTVCHKGTYYKCNAGSFENNAATSTGDPCTSTVGAECDNAGQCTSGVCNSGHCVASSNDCWSSWTEANRVVFGGSTVCVDGKVKQCSGGKFVDNGSCSGGIGDHCDGTSKCASGICEKWHCMENKNDCWSDELGIIKNGSNKCDKNGKTQKCSNGGLTESVIAADACTTAVLSGICGSANGSKYSGQPASNLCLSGTLSWSDTVASDGTYNWKCGDVACSATKGVVTSCTSVGGVCKGSCEITEESYAAGVGECVSNVCCKPKTITAAGTGVCKSAGGTCRTLCETSEVRYDAGRDECSPATCCTPIVGTAKKDGDCGSVLGSAYHPSDANACDVGNVSWTDISGTDGTDGFNWNCVGVAGGATVSCSSKKVAQDPNCTSMGGVCKSYKDCITEGKPYVGGGKGCVAGLSAEDYPEIVCCGTGTSKTDGTTGGTTGGTTTSGTSIPATAIALSPTSATLAVGTTKAITATLTPSNSTDSIVWTSSNNAVATVTTKGIITGASAGTAIITATTTSGKTATVVVTITAASSGSTSISFKFAFAGIKPKAACISALGDLSLEVANIPTSVIQTGLATGFAKLDDAQVDSKGNQIFQVTSLALDAAKFSTVNTLNYVKVKGPFHLKRRMCQDGQSSKLSESTTCNINLTSGIVYNFSGYTLLAGDTDQNGVINSIDFSYVKSQFDAAADVSCGRKGDLNMDGVVNALDINLVKEALSSRDDE